ncbi:hypothetical protein ACHAPT_008288 [Fusarium lateritium]
MRVLSLALALFTADVAVGAALCRPASTRTASQSVSNSAIESSTATVPTTSATASDTSATETVTSASETATSESSFTTLTSSTTLAGTTSTTAAASTTSFAAPSETPGSVVGSGPVANLPLKGTGDRYSPLSFATSSSSARTLIFSLSGGRLQESNGNYLCVSYRPQGSPPPLVLCPYDDGYNTAPLTCQQRPDGAVSCTSPIGYCDHEVVEGGEDDPNDLNSCVRYNTGKWTQFYTNDGQDASFGDVNGNFGSYTAIVPRLV